ncbi:hypothetical protein PsorP6_000772 [Peronosclerospora sorghi]|uniref:Uncharacterized protein n=1 Tax=Peronosclerospora sorghi TaxID=230839 RepID=A0ACC0WVA1_9STRA|nr:hypothetical protein PsorP6_000772 [Peronosclerospora sorghi]
MMAPAGDVRIANFDLACGRYTVQFSRRIMLPPRHATVISVSTRNNKIPSNGKKKIHHNAGMLRLGDHYVDSDFCIGALELNNEESSASTASGSASTSTEAASPEVSQENRAQPRRRSYKAPMKGHQRGRCQSSSQGQQNGADHASVTESIASLQTQSPTAD